MLPGGEREFVQWLVPTVATGASGTSSTSQSACAQVAQWAAEALPGLPMLILSPAMITGPGILALILLQAKAQPVYAADSGVVTMATGRLQLWLWQCHSDRSWEWIFNCLRPLELIGVGHVRKRWCRSMDRRIGQHRQLTGRAPAF